MTSENLLAIHKPQRFEANATGALSLLAVAERNLADAGIEALSRENRFDAAYKQFTAYLCGRLAICFEGFSTFACKPLQNIHLSPGLSLRKTVALTPPE